MTTVCLWSFKWSHLIINTEKYQECLIQHPATEDGFIHVVWWIVKDSEWKIYLHHNARLNEFYIPGGKLEFWESFEEALHRELQEELWITVVKSHHHYTLKYIVWIQRCMHIFVVDTYTWIPLNNDSHKYDQYRAEIIDSDNALGFAVKVDGTITDDGQDIMQSYRNLYHMLVIPRLLDWNDISQYPMRSYDVAKINPSHHYYLYLDQEKKEYYFEIV